MCLRWDCSKFRSRISPRAQFTDLDLTVTAGTCVQPRMESSKSCSVVLRQRCGMKSLRGMRLLFLPPVVPANSFVTYELQHFILNFEIYSERRGTISEWRVSQ